MLISHNKALIIQLLLFLSLISCSSRNDKGKAKNGQKSSDSLVRIALYNLNPFSISIDSHKKKKFVVEAITSAMPDWQAFHFLEKPCLKYDLKTGQYRDTIQKAPDCRLDEFHLIDIDNDEDIDVVYSSLIDQYQQFDFNTFIILRNENGRFKRSDIDGYLYSADFSQLKTGKLFLKTVVRPCCDQSTYNFFETTIYTNTWTIKSRSTAKIHESKITEIF